MLKFTVRDLLWLTLVVALGLGWFIRERQVRDKEAVMDIAIHEAKIWQGGAGALEMALAYNDYQVTWRLSDWEVLVTPANNKARNYVHTVYNLKYCKPSAGQ